MEPSIVLVCLCNPRNYDSSNGHFFLKVEILFVAEFIQTRSNWRFMTDLNKTAGFGNCSNVTDYKISLVENQFGSILQDCVSIVTIGLSFCISLFKEGTRPIWFDKLPYFLIKHWLSWTQLKTSFFISANDSGHENTFLAHGLSNISSNLIGKLAELNHSECLFIKLHGHPKSNRFYKSHNN